MLLKGGIFMQTKRSTLTFRLSLSAAFLALALICKLFFSIPISFLGVGGIRIGFAGIFTAFPAILFGPLYGGVVSALSDLLGVLIKPEGAYIPWLTVTAFLGGYLKGWLFRWLLHPKAFRAFSKGLAIFFLCIGLLGGVLHISLASDGIISSFPTTKEEVPYRHEVDAQTLSPLSKTIVDLAFYNKDSYTLTTVRAQGDIVIPSQVMLYATESDQTEHTVHIWNQGGKITKIGKNAFQNASQDAKIYIPTSVTGIDKDAFAGRTDLTICAKADSAAYKFAKEHQLPFEETNVKAETVYVDSERLQNSTFDLRSSDTYRKYLSGYLNSLTLGLEIVGILGACSFVYMILRKKKEIVIGSYPQIFLSIALSGLLVTTVNTEILRIFTAAWTNRAFWILWVPRVAEELIVCSIQAYMILLLYNVYRKKIKPRSAYLRNLKY